MSSRIVETATNIILPFMILFGIYLIVHGHITPGGGFQGGVVLGACMLLICLVFCPSIPKRTFLIFENIGALIFLLIGLMGILFGGVLFSNFILKGTAGTILSGGTVPFINIAIGLKVAGGFAVLFFTVLYYIERRE